MLEISPTGLEHPLGARNRRKTFVKIRKKPAPGFNRLSLAFFLKFEVLMNIYYAIKNTWHLDALLHHVFLGIFTCFFYPISSPSGSPDHFWPYF